MSKVPLSNKFIDLSDYGRQPGTWIALLLKNTFMTPVKVTFLFFIVGLTSAYFILNESYYLAASLIIFKSILDATDGELARLRNTPSYVGRFVDSIADFILNLIFFITISISVKSSLFNAILVFFCFQLQGTLYNYYYVIYRRNVSGDQTSRIFETEPPLALGNESQSMVNLLFWIYRLFYGLFDNIIYNLDYSASKSNYLPKILMTASSIFGLGFQLLILSVFLIFRHLEFIFPFFLTYTIFIPILIIFRIFIEKRSTK